MSSFLNISQERTDAIIEHLLLSVPLTAIFLAGLVIIIRLAFSAMKGNLARSLQEKRIPLIAKIEQYLMLFLVFLVALEVIIPGRNIALSLSLAALTFVLVLRLFFYDVLRNFIAGLLIRVEHTIKVGNQLIIAPYIGVVESLGKYNITLKTNKSTTVSIPNNLIFDQHFVIQSPGSLCCEEYDVDVGNTDNLEQVQKIVKRATIRVKEVEAEPGVKALVQDLDLKHGYRSVIVRVSWWVNPMEVDVKELRSNVIYSIKLALDKSQIGLTPLKSVFSNNQSNISPIK